MTTVKDFLKAQLPEGLAWGDKATKIGIKGAPVDPDSGKVKSLVAQLLRVDSENTDKILAYVSMDAAGGDKVNATLSAIPPKPTKWFRTGAHKIQVTVTFENGVAEGFGSKIYRGLEKAP